jgi:hypothetical protein
LCFACLPHPTSPQRTTHPNSSPIAVLQSVEGKQAAAEKQSNLMTLTVMKLAAKLLDFG